jgi:Acylphosphatases
MQETCLITVTGKVQGVFYRQSTKEKALELGITGTVKNLPNGDVEIMASGTPQQLNALVAWCKQGPPRAQVKEVRVEKQAPHAFLGFTIQR